MKTVAAYSAARAAQVGYVQAVGVELAPDNVQVNLIAQNYVENPVYYPPEVTQHNERFQASLKRQVPLGRLATAREDALFALFLASERAVTSSSARPFPSAVAGRSAESPPELTYERTLQYCI